MGNREAMEQRMLDKAMEEVTHLQEAVLAEKKAREDTENAMMRMMEDIVQKVQGEIQLERSEREKTEEQLLHLLDQTCNKLCAAQQQHLVPGRCRRASGPALTSLRGFFFYYCHAPVSSDE